MPIRVQPFAARLRAWRSRSAGLRIASPLGPIRFDVGYNNYQLESGAVYTTNAAGDLVLLRENFVQDRKRPRYTLHFSVGQAF